jgi:NAD(P)-dependent dehydrogenase (short-subunit alcohol dehydrogenase family)
MLSAVNVVKGARCRPLTYHIFSTHRSFIRVMLSVAHPGNGLVVGRNGSVYCGSKAAITMLTRCWSQDLSPYAITVRPARRY